MWWTLVACAVVIECILIGGLLLPLRMDQAPPSLDTNLAHVYGLDTIGLLLYLGVAGGLLGAYGMALRAVRSAPPRAVVGVVAASGVFMATLLSIHPTYSSDVLHYVATARVAFVHGENPHLVPPEVIADDPLMLLSDWRSLPSPYGAGWTWLSAVPYALSGGLDTVVRAVVAFKLLAVLCVLGASAGVAVAGSRLRPGAGVVAAVAFGWNPLVIIHFAGDGHNDAPMLLLLAWGLAALTAQRRTGAFLLFAAATLIKPAAGLALLMLAVSMARNAHWKALMGGTALAVLLAVILYAPLWNGFGVLRPMLEESGYYTNTPASLLRHLAGPLIGEDTSERLIGGGARALLLAVALYLGWRLRPSVDDLSLRIGIVYLLAVAVLSTWYQPWYATWPLLFLSVALSVRPVWMWPVVGLTTGGLLIPVATNFVAGITGRPAEDVRIDALAVALVLVPLAVSLLPVIRRRTAHGPKIEAPVFSAS
jgi:hypothetical protein